MSQQPTNGVSGVPAVQGAGWAIVAQGWTIALSLGSTVLFARLLTPSDFAVLAVVLPITGTLQSIQSLGIAAAIIQARTIDSRQLDALFWISMALSTVLALGLVIASPLIAGLLGDSRLTSVLPIAALAVVGAALSSQPNAILARGLHFKAIAVRNVAALSIGTLAGLTVAFATRSFWALLVGPILVPFVSFAISARIAHWRPGWPGLCNRARPLLGFGLQMWCANLLNFTARNADNLLIAWATTSRDLGIYDRAYRLLLYPINQAVLPLGQFMLPTLSRHVDLPQQYKDYYWRAVTLLLLLCQPGLVVAIIFPTTVIGLLLGPDWLEGAPVFAWFGVAGLFQIFLGTTSWLFTSQGRGQEYMWLSLGLSVVALASFVAGLGGGIVGVARAYTIGQAVIALPVTLKLAGGSGPVRHRDFLQQLAPHCLALTGVLLLVGAIRWQFGAPRWSLLIATVGLSYAVYFAALLAGAPSRRLLADLLVAARRVVWPGRFDWPVERTQP